MFQDLKNKAMIIYRIMNVVNNKVYIGQTSRTFYQRYTGGGDGVERVYNMYITEKKKANKHLLNSFIKHGLHNFKVDIIRQCETIEELNYWEEFFIALYNSTDQRYGYNRKYGGENHKRGWSYQDTLNNTLKKLSEKEGELLIAYLDKIKKRGGDRKKALLEIKKRKVVVFNKQAPTKCWIYRDIIDCCDTHTGCMQPHKTHLICKQNEEDEFYINNFPLRKQNTYIIKFYKNEKELKDYEIVNKRNRSKIRVTDTRKSGTTHKYTYRKKEKKEKSVHTCQLCGNTYKIVSKYCADCRMKMENEKKIEGKPKRECPVCKKEHYRGNSQYCSTNCSNKARWKRKTTSRKVEMC